MKIKISLLFLLIVLFQTTQAQIGRLALSPFQESKIKIATTDISIAYSRPSMKGRKIFGDLVPYDKWWRTGANRNTTIEFTEDVFIDKKRVNKGKYAIFTKPTPDNWKVIFYKKTDNWNVPETIDTTQIVASITVKVKNHEERAEVLSISIGDFTNYKFDLNIAWDTTKVTIPIELTTKEIMENKISRVIGGPSPDDFYAAAVYEMESGKNYKRGIKWIDSAIKTREKPSWWDLRVKAILLMQTGEKENAATIAEKALSMAENEKHEYGINEMKRVLKELKKK